MSQTSIPSFCNKVLSLSGNIPGKANAILWSLEYFFNNEKMRRVMALAARRLTEEKYDLNIMKKRLEALFN